MDPVFGISNWVKGVQIIPKVSVSLSVAKALEEYLSGGAWVDYNPAYAHVAVHLNSNDPGLQEEVLNLMASFFRGR